MENRVGTSQFLQFPAARESVSNSNKMSNADLLFPATVRGGLEFGIISTDSRPAGTLSGFFWKPGQNNN